MSPKDCAKLRDDRRARRRDQVRAVRRSGRAGCRCRISSVAGAGTGKGAVRACDRAAPIVQRWRRRPFRRRAPRCRRRRRRCRRWNRARRLRESRRPPPARRESCLRRRRCAGRWRARASSRTCDSSLCSISSRISRWLRPCACSCCVVVMPVFMRSVFMPVLMPVLVRVFVLHAVLVRVLVLVLVVVRACLAMLVLVAVCVFMLAVLVVCDVRARAHARGDDVRVSLRLVLIVRVRRAFVDAELHAFDLLPLRPLEVHVKVADRRASRAPTRGWTASRRDRRARRPSCRR